MSNYFDSINKKLAILNTLASRIAKVYGDWGYGLGSYFKVHWGPESQWSIGVSYGGYDGHKTALELEGNDLESLIDENLDFYADVADLCDLIRAEIEKSGQEDLLVFESDDWAEIKLSDGWTMKLESRKADVEFFKKILTKLKEINHG